MNQPPLVGQTLRSRYQIIKSLGSGGFGDTYLAQDLDLPNKPYCVVKHLKPKTNDPAVLPIAKTLFDREAQSLYQLGNNSDQIPQLFAHFEENSQFYLVQEFVDGHDLTKEIIPGQIQSEEFVRQLLKDILEVLAVVHQNNVIHRDIKPQNLMRRQSDGKIVLIDFGAVKEIGTLLINTQGETSVSVAIGSPGYMPNEQTNGRPKFASDVYAVGMMGIQALTGFFPQQLQEDPETGEIIWRDYAQVSDELAEILDKMVRDHFSQRYQTASAALEALMPIIEPLSIITPLTPFPTVPSPSPVVPPTTGTASPATRRKFLTLLSFAGVGLAGVAVWELVKRSFTSSPIPSSSLPPSSPIPSSSLPPSSSISLKSFSFDVVKVNAQGKPITPSTQQAKFFSENLGNNITLDMVAISGGTFTMGSPSSEAERDSNESPQHQVTVKPFYMGKYEVTQAQYEVIMGKQPSEFKGANRPVEKVSWNDAVEFCKRLSQKTGRSYRLPSEAEWEYACRAGTSTPFCFGETITTNLANYDGTKTYSAESKGKNREETTDVGTFPPNSFGLYDMHGNVWEWCLDTSHNSYDGAPTDGSAWIDENKTQSRLMRGGSWYDAPSDSRSAARYSESPDTRDDDFGFRVVVSA
jgi:formylglycine-generating enzyme required for sulfatase activity